MDELAPFSSEELASVELGLEEIRAGRVLFSPPIHVIGRLLALWGQPVAAPAPGEFWPETGEKGLQVPRFLADLQTGDGTSSDGIPWSMGMTEEFAATSQDVAPSLHRGMLEALAHICLMPTLPMGETVKPLTGMLDGLWRYRLGGSRLVYRPNTAEKRVAVVTLVPKAGVR